MNISSDLLYELTFGVFEKITALTNVLLEFLFLEIITLPIGDSGDLTITMWEVLGGVGLVVMLVAWLVKKIVPLI